MLAFLRSARRRRSSEGLYSTGFCNSQTRRCSGDSFPKKSSMGSSSAPSAGANSRLKSASSQPKAGEPVGPCATAAAIRTARLVLLVASGGATTFAGSLSFASAGRPASGAGVLPGAWPPPCSSAAQRSKPSRLPSGFCSSATVCSSCEMMSCLRTIWAFQLASSATIFSFSFVSSVRAPRREATSCCEEATAACAMPAQQPQ
mmetsp:Transcript_38684/g.82286  ORF Transcript_38684/g.82286 Transcript_38684/m.82286 type:complete len:203 (-) Transcript_38684:53-661(-)